MKQKVINIYFSNGEIFQIPAEVVANNRDSYYKEEENEIVDDSYDDYELYDWFQNNMDWDDVAPHAVRINDQDEPDYHLMMRDAKIEVLVKY